VSAAAGAAGVSPCECGAAMVRLRCLNGGSDTTMCARDWERFRALYPGVYAESP